MQAVECRNTTFIVHYVQSFLPGRFNYRTTQATTRIIPMPEHRFSWGQALSLLILRCSL